MASKGSGGGLLLVAAALGVGLFALSSSAKAMGTTAKPPGLPPGQPPARPPVGGGGGPTINVTPAQRYLAGCPVDPTLPAQTLSDLQAYVANPGVTSAQLMSAASTYYALSFPMTGTCLSAAGARKLQEENSGVGVAPTETVSGTGSV